MHLSAAQQAGEREVWSNYRHVPAAAAHFGLLQNFLRSPLSVSLNSAAAAKEDPGTYERYSPRRVPADRSELADSTLLLLALQQQR
jgi:hypothetical protein